MNINKYQYIYLHGFASSPESGKAQFYQNQLSKHNLPVEIPNLNGSDFTFFTITKAIAQVQNIIDKLPDKPIILIGSSMGGLISCILAETNPQIKKLILLAPAFQMSKLWKDGITQEQLKSWQETSYQNTYHYGYTKEVKLHYNFYTDLFTHNDSNFIRNIPCLIFHGIHDDVVPIYLSEEYVKSHPNSKLISLDDDHSVNKHLDKTWDLSLEFILDSRW